MTPAKKRGTAVRASIATIGALYFALSGIFSVSTFPSAAMRCYAAIGLTGIAYSAWTLLAAVRAGQTRPDLVRRSRITLKVADWMALATVPVGVVAGLVLALIRDSDWEIFGFFVAESLVMALFVLLVTLGFASVINAAEGRR